MSTRQHEEEMEFEFEGEGEFEFEQVADGQNSITELIRSFVDFNYGAVNITIACLALMIICL